MRILAKLAVIVISLQMSMVFAADATYIKPPSVQSKKLITRIFHTDPAPIHKMLDPTTAYPSPPAIYHLSKIPSSIPLSQCKIYKREVTTTPRWFCSQIYLSSKDQWGRFYYMYSVAPDNKFIYGPNMGSTPNVACRTSQNTALNIKEFEAIVRGGDAYRQMPQNNNGGTPNHPHEPTACTCEQMAAGGIIVVGSDWVEDNTLDLSRIQDNYHTTPLQIVCHEYK